MLCFQEALETADATNNAQFGGRDAKNTLTALQEDDIMKNFAKNTIMKPKSGKRHKRDYSDCAEEESCDEDNPCA